MKVNILFESSSGLGKLKSLRGKMVIAAQDIYDEWDEDEDEYGGGGICHLISDAICEVLSDNDIEDCASVSCAVGEVHVFAVARMEDGVYEIDISPYRYETGGGYSWEKVPDVKFDVEDIVISRLSDDPDEFENFIEEGLLESYSRVGGKVSGLEVTDNIPDQNSISASLDDYEIIGLVEIPLSEFELSGRSYSVSETNRIKKLASDIKSNGWIDPLIVVEDSEGLYILEGGHRAEALYLLGKESLPALLVKDKSDESE